MIYFYSELETFVSDLGGAPVSTGTSSGYRLQMERPSPDWAKKLTANKNVSYNYALAA